MELTRNIGTIGNYYGGLSVKKEDNKFYWGIEDWDSDYGWQEIPESLYNEIISFEKTKNQKSNDTPTT